VRATSCRESFGEQQQGLEVMISLAFIVSSWSWRWDEVHKSRANLE